MKFSRTLSALAIAIGAISSAGAQSFLTNGLVAFYPFNGDARDASGNGNNATVHGAQLAVNRFGDSNQAYVFNGAGDYLEIADAPANDLEPQFTISFWVNPQPGYGAPNQGDIHVVSKWGQGGVGKASYTVGLTSSGQLYVATCDPVTTTVVDDTTVTPTGVWHQVILTRDGAGFHLYRDNRLLFSSNSLRQPQQSGYKLSFGRDAFTNSAFYKGALDDVRIYNRALSAQEVRDLYAFESQPRPWVDIEVKSVKVTLHVTPTKTYQLQGSADLAAWTNVGQPFVATTSEIIQEFNTELTGRFFRIQLLP